VIYICKTFNKTCFHCKSTITIKRHDNIDIVYFDNHFYHKQCLIDVINSNVKKLIRKCGCCNKEFNLLEENNVIFYDKKYHHYDCFIDKCNSMKTLKWKNALNYLDKYIGEAKINIELLLNSQKLNINSMNEYENDATMNINRIFAESDVDTFIKNNYNPTKIPWNTLSRIYNGNYKNLTKPIPAEDLLDMWRQKINFLNKTAERNRQTGNVIEGDARIVYDLAVLANKYDGYLKWKEDQRIALAENESKETVNINYLGINNNRQDNTNNSIVNINNILDEI
jgi:hypothetical protein